MTLYLRWKVTLGLDIDEGTSHSRMSQRSRTNNEESFRRRAPSPPVPAIKHRPHVENDYNVDNYNYDNLNAKDSGSNIERKDRVESRGQSDINGQFVPFVRSTNVLDPAHAESPVPMSRENTAVSFNSMYMARSIPEDILISGAFP